MTYKIFLIYNIPYVKFSVPRRVRYEAVLLVTLYIHGIAYNFISSKRVNVVLKSRVDYPVDILFDSVGKKISPINRISSE